MSATLAVKVVPKASRDRVVGRYGDAIKVQVSAPPEAGKANRAVVELIAATLGVKSHQVEVIAGHAQPRKTLRIDGLEPADLAAKLADLR